MADDRANSARGEAVLRIDGRDFMLRPSFAALVAAEEELGSLFALVERASAGELTLAELATLFWHLLVDRTVSRDVVGAAIMAQGLAATTPALKVILKQILQGTASE